MFSKRNHEIRAARKVHIRKNLSGSHERPRLTVFRSLSQIYAQVIDDLDGRTLVAAASSEPELAADKAKKKDRAKQVGQLVAKRCLEKGIDKVVFDRNGYLYHGRVAELAAGARAGGLKF